MNTVIVGGGTMGSAYARCFLQSGLMARGDLLIVEARAERRDELAAEFRCRVLDAVDASCADAEVLLLAVKPQDLEPICAAMRGGGDLKGLVISIMAGIPLVRLAEGLGGVCRLVRCMPNMPVQIGEGMTVYCPFPGLAQEDCDLAERLLRSTGLCLKLEGEELIDAATALSGSGPGYVYYLLEHVLKAAGELGFSPAEADLLTAQTIKGALEQWRRGEHDAAELRAAVTSKGGTTAAALDVFESGKVGEILAAGIKRACARAKELGKT